MDKALLEEIEQVNYANKTLEDKYNRINKDLQGENKQLLKKTEELERVLQNENAQRASDFKKKCSKWQ